MKNDSNAKRVAAPLGLAAVLLVAALALFRAQVAQPTEVPTPPPVAVMPPDVEQAKASPRAEVMVVEGSVERQHQGQWAPVKAGEFLEVDDSVRTAARARAELSVGNGSRITVAENTELKVRELTEVVHRFKLARGRLSVAYDEKDQRVLRVEDESGGSIAETKGARFTVLSTGQALAISTETGTVRLGSAGATVDVGAGQQAVAKTGAAPSAAEAIPSDVVLKLARLTTAALKEMCAKVEGRAAIGSQVVVDGEPVTVEPSGRFALLVPRKPGQRTAHVVVTSPTGQEQVDEVPCSEAPTSGTPKLDATLRWGTRQGG